MLATCRHVVTRSPFILSQVYSYVSRLLNSYPESHQRPCVIKICSPAEQAWAFRTCRSQALCEPKHSPEDDAKRPFAVTRTLFGRAVLHLCQFSSLSDSTAEASVQNPNSYQCVTDCHHTVGLAHHLLAIISFCEVFQLFSTDLFKTEVGISNLIVLSIS